MKLKLITGLLTALTLSACAGEQIVPVQVIEPPVPVRSVLRANQGWRLVDKGALLIDVRDPGVFAHSHIDRAVNIPLPELVAQQENLLKDRVAIEMKRYFKSDFKRIGHATRVARHAEKIGKSAQDVSELVKEFKNATENITRISDVLAQTFSTLDTILWQNMGYFRTLMSNSREISENLENFTGALRHNPSALLLSKPAQKRDLPH